MLYARPPLFLSELTNGAMFLGQRTVLFFFLSLTGEAVYFCPLRYCR